MALTPEQLQQAQQIAELYKQFYTQAAPEQRQIISAQGDTQSEFDPASITVQQANRNLEEYNKWLGYADEYQRQLAGNMSEPLQKAMEEIDKKYEDQMKDAVDAESIALINERIDNEKQAARQQIEAQIRPALDEARKNQGLPTLANILVEVQSLRPAAQEAQQKLTAVRTGQPGAYDPNERAEKAVAESRIAKQERTLNVFRAMEQAEAGSDEDKERFLEMVESVEDPQLQRETVQILRNLGFQAPRPIRLNNGEVIQPAGAASDTGSSVGGGYALMKNGTYRVYLPDGGTTTAATEEEAKSMSQSSPTLATQSQVSKVFGEKRRQFRNELENNIASARQGLANLMGVNQGMGEFQPGMDSEPFMDGSDNTATKNRLETPATSGQPQNRKTFTGMSRPENIISLPGLFYGASIGAEKLGDATDKTLGWMGRTAESFITGKEPEFVSDMPLKSAAESAVGALRSATESAVENLTPSTIPAPKKNTKDRSTFWGGMWNR